MDPSELTACPPADPKEESGTVEAWFSGESSLEKEAIGLNRKELDEISTQLKAQATAVRGILSR